ncbi:MAG TPA: MFS transporter [Ktedonobacteraceae bacterium]|nr:MFS transporter [Ktedonobacteraceae bacterium]
MSIETPETQMPTGNDVPTPPAKYGFLINRNFALLAFGQAISNMGDFVFSTTLLIWVFLLTHSAVAVSGVLIAQYTPVFLLGPVAGVFVDRWNRRRTMVVADVARGVAALLPLVVPVAMRLPAIYASVFIIASFSRFFMPAKSAVLQVIVPNERQPQAASISQATMALSFIVGPALASPLYFVVGPFVAIIINAVSYIVSALSLSALRASREALQPSLMVTSPVEQAPGGFRAVMRELGAGFSFVGRTRVLLMVTLLALIAMLGAGALNALDIIFVSRNLHVESALYGPLAAVGGLGALIGAIGAGLLASKLQARRMLTLSVILTGVGILIYSFQTIYVAGLIFNFLACLPQGGIDVGFGPLLIRTTPRTMMGRVQSVIDTTMFGTSLLSIALAGFFGQFIPVNVIFAIGGILILVAGLFGWFAIPEPSVAIVEHIDKPYTV